MRTWAVVVLLVNLAACGYRPDSALAAAAFKGDNVELRRLLPGSDSGAIQEALVAAARAGNGAAVPFLVAAGARVEERSGVNNWTPLQHAIHKNRPASVRALLAAGADPQTGLSLAAGYGQAEIVAALLAKGADPHRAEGRGNALDFALSGAGDIDRWTLGNCQTSTVRVLLSHAPDLRPTREYKRGRCAEIDGLLAGGAAQAGRR